MTTASACCDSCTPTDDTALAIACTLAAGDFKERVASIRDLAMRSLRISQRRGLVLDLVYDPTARAEVEDLVAKESDCCAFLSFDLQEDASGLRLTIAAPEAAASAADELFAHFAPELAKVAT